MSRIGIAEFKAMSEDDQDRLINLYRKVYIDENNNLQDSDRIANVNTNLGQLIRSTKLPRKSFSQIISKSSSTYRDKTGYDHPMNNPLVVNKLKQTNEERYGGVGFQCEELASRSRSTTKQRYGVDNFAKSELFAERFEQSSLNKYGVSNPAKLDSVKSKIKETQEKKYGKWYAQTDDFKKRSVETFMRNYGVSNPMHSEEVINKIQQQNMKKWGVPYWMMLPESQKKLKEGSIKKFGTIWYSSAHLSKECLDIIHDSDKLVEYVLKFPKERRTHNNIAESLGCSAVYLSELTRSYGDKVRDAFTMMPSVSSAEMTVRDILSEWNIDAEYNDRSVLKPKELDIYVPSHNFAIEFDGWYWHSKQAGTPVNYHQDKSRSCAEKGIQLYHIFENDWNDGRKRAIIKSQLKAKLVGNCERIFARNCILKEVSVDDAREFLNDNHLQGYRNCSIRLGLYCNDELVCIMTFGKAYLHRDSSCWEIYRQCSKMNYIVVGGSSKLFKAFLLRANPDKVITYSDFATGTGNVYTVLGFSPVRLTAPNYKWISEKDEKSRYQCQFKDEVRIMESNHYVQLYDAGNILWEWRKLDKLI